MPRKTGKRNPNVWWQCKSCGCQFDAIDGDDIVKTCGSCAKAAGLEFQVHRLHAAIRQHRDVRSDDPSITYASPGRRIEELEAALRDLLQHFPTGADHYDCARDGCSECQAANERIAAVKAAKQVLG